MLLPCSRNLACGENSHALRLANASLRESLADLRAANANRIRCAFGARSRVRFARSATNNKAQSFLDWALLLEVPPGIEPGIEVLQTFALPLGHGTIFR